MPEESVFLVRVLNLERDSGYFHAESFGDEALAQLQPGELCVVDHSGERLGEVTGVLEAGSGVGEQLERIVRLASRSDVEAHQHNCAEAERILSSTREAIARHGLPMHLVAAEYTLDRAQLRINFTAPHRVDFRALLRELAARYGTHIELRQMGARDEARLKGGIARCGQVLCCHRFLHSPRPIPMELAYDQELFVPPERITGVCGRLMCCLAYEHEAYKSELARFPKLGTWVAYRDERGKVIAHNIFRQTVTLLTPDKERIEVDVAKVTAASTGKKRH
jgi:cell fate regulator YaaT (PSP1 superfamily)